MRRFLKRVLWATATLLAFYGGLALAQYSGGIGQCSVPANCQVGNCTQFSNPNTGCKYNQGGVGNVCIVVPALPPPAPPPPNPSPTCWNPPGANQISCSGINNYGQPCSGFIQVCSGSCPGYPG